MLRGPQVDHLDPLPKRGHHHQQPVLLESPTGDGRSRGPLQRRFQGLRQRLSQRLVRRHAPGASVFVVLGLGHQVGGDPVGPCAGVGQDEHLGGTGDHVDAHVAHHLPLGFGHPAVARPDDLVHSWNGGGPERERADRLGPADLEDAGDPGERAGRENRVGHAVGGNHRDDFPDPGHDGRHRVHDDRARIGRLPPRHVEAHAVDRRHPHTQQGAVRLGDAESVVSLVFVVGPNPIHGMGEGLADRAGCPVEPALPGVGLELPVLWREVDTVELPGILPDGFITPPPDGLEDSRHLIAGFRVLAARGRQERLEQGKGGDVQPADHWELALNSLRI